VFVVYSLRFRIGTGNPVMIVVVVVVIVAAAVLAAEGISNKI
jgi:hypothetical protein